MILKLTKVTSDADANFGALRRHELSSTEWNWHVTTPPRSLYTYNIHPCQGYVHTN